MLDQETDLDTSAQNWLRQLVGDWQLLSDLSFADLVLLVPHKGDPAGYVAVAQARPSTAATMLYEDVVGRTYRSTDRPQVDAAYRSEQIQQVGDPRLVQETPLREEAIPVRMEDRVVGVLVRYTNLASTRIPSRLELTYQRAADVIITMVACGQYPAPGTVSAGRRGSPRVGDGLFWLDVDGRCLYASPNAVSTLHRMGLSGELSGRNLSEVIMSLFDGVSQVDEALALVVTGKAPWSTEVATRGVTMSMRAIPLYEGGERTAAIVLSRDITELRHQELELLSKQATIREVHHRVKNNLQTVSALLRLQARRIESPEARDALEEAMRRVSTIAFVHETLAHGIEETLDFDRIIDRGLTLTAGLATSTQEKAPRPVREGSFGQVGAEDATALALVLVELVANAVEHGLPDGGGSVRVVVDRGENSLHVEVVDDGLGLPEGFSPGTSGLGTQIVEALVVGELRGDIHWLPADGGGTRVVLEAVVR